MDSDDGDSDVELDRKERLVIFGKIDLTVKAGLAHHWGVKLVECPHDPPCHADPPDKPEGEEAEEEEESEGMIISSLIFRLQLGPFVPYC